MKPSDRIWELANERCVRHGVNPTVVALQDVANYLDEQHGLVVIVAPEWATENERGKMAEQLEPLSSRHDIVILPFGYQVLTGAAAASAMVPSVEAKVARVGDDVRGEVMARQHAPFGFVAVPFSVGEAGPTQRPTVVRTEGELRATTEPPCACCGGPASYTRFTSGGPLRCDWCMENCRMVDKLHQARPGVNTQNCANGLPIHDMQGKPVCPACGYEPRLAEA